MLLLAIKTIAIAMIILISLLVGRLPLVGQTDGMKTRKRWQYAEAFACGIFLGTACFHLLPEAIKYFNQIQGGSHFAYAPFVCCLTVFLLYLFEVRLSRLNSSRSQIAFPMLLVGVMCVHAIFAGAALGWTTQLTSVILLLFAIMAHKGSETFALSFYCSRKLPSIALNWKILFIFTLMTPIGIALGMFTNALQQNAANLSYLAYLHAITAGSFIYIGLFHSFKGLLAHKSFLGSIELCGISVLSFLVFPLFTIVL